MTLEDAVDAMTHAVLEFAASFEADTILSAEDKRDPYIAFGEFGSFLRRIVPQRSLEDSKIVARFRFLTDDPGIRDLVSAGTLELLLDKPETIRAARQLLSDRSLDDFGGADPAMGVRHWASLVLGCVRPDAPVRARRHPREVQPAHAGGHRHYE